MGDAPMRQVSDREKKSQKTPNKEKSFIWAQSSSFHIFLESDRGMGPSFPFCLLILSLVESNLATYPFYPVQSRAAPPYPLYQPPSYLLYPNGVYKLMNVTNETNQVKGQDFVFGTRTPQDKLLLHTTVYKRPGIWSSYASKEITFPPPGNSMRVNITQVKAFDRGVNGTGGFVKMARGGVGRENVTLLFRSQKNRPINFELDIFGVPMR